MDNLPSPDLYDRIINNINREHKLLLIKRRLAWYGANLLVSLAMLKTLGQSMSADLRQSDFLEILSLLATDFQAVFLNLGDFSRAALESVPLLTLALSGLFLVLSVYSLSRLASLAEEWKKFDKTIRNP